jgi:hypothetical protein
MGMEVEPSTPEEPPLETLRAWANPLVLVSASTDESLRLTTTYRRLSRVEIPRQARHARLKGGHLHLPRSLLGRPLGKRRSRRTPQVGRHSVTAGFGRERKLVTPGVPQLGETVHQHHRRSGARFRYVHPEPLVWIRRCVNGVSTADGPRPAAAAALFGITYLLHRPVQSDSAPTLTTACYSAHASTAARLRPARQQVRIARHRLAAGSAGA